jgi:hypothetical protein
MGARRGEARLREAGRQQSRRSEQKEFLHGRYLSVRVEFANPNVSRLFL